MLAWSEELITVEKTRNHGYDVIVGELFTDYSDHPRKLVTLNLKLKSTGAGRYQLLSRWWDAYRKQQLKDFSRKVRTLWHCTLELRSVALYYDWSWWYPSGSRPFAAISGLTAGAGYGQFEHKGWQPDCKIQRSGPNSPERLMYEQGIHPIISALVITIIVCLSWAVNHYRDLPLPTKPSATKMPENWSWRTRQLLTCRCVSVMLLRSMQNTRRS